jgi:hypothetical protein
MVQAEKDKASEPPVEEKQEETQAPPETQEENKTPEQTPAKLVIDDEEYDEAKIRELKAGNLRTQDYTQKTQEAARIRREAEDAIRIVEHIKKNPKALAALQAVEELAPEVSDHIDPVKSKTISQERELNDLRLRNEINEMQAKYEDFEVVDVLQYALENSMPNLELAYSAWKGSRKVETKQESSPPVDVEALRAEMRKELLAEIASEQASTSTIITSKSTPPETKQDDPLSPAEDKVRKAQGLTVEEYKKWKTKR